MKECKILPPKVGYNLIAPYYDTWKWQGFWRENEFPYIERWCCSLSKGLGADLGVGSGNNLRCFFDSGHNVIAYDISDMMLRICQHKYTKEITEGKLRCYVEDINRLNEYNYQYDWLLCNRVFSHIKDVSNVIKKMSHVLKPGGMCFISDVHPLHHYNHTHYRMGDDQDLVIETYKHRLQELENQFHKYCLDVIESKEVKKAMLINKEASNCINSIQDDESPIFYYYILRRKQGI